MKNLGSAGQRRKNFTRHTRRIQTETESPDSVWKENLTPQNADGIIAQVCGRKATIKNDAAIGKPAAVFFCFYG